MSLLCRVESNLEFSTTGKSSKDTSNRIRIRRASYVEPIDSYVGSKLEILQSLDGSRISKVPRVSIILEVSRVSIVLEISKVSIVLSFYFFFFE